MSRMDLPWSVRRRTTIARPGGDDDVGLHGRGTGQVGGWCCARLFGTTGEAPSRWLSAVSRELLARLQDFRHAQHDLALIRGPRH